MTSRLRQIVAFAAFAGLWTATAAFGQPALENKLKAAIVSKFPQFVEWPATAFDGRTSVDICVALPDRLGTDLEDLVTGESLNGRPVTVRRIDRDQDLEGCHALFVAAGSVAARRALLQRAAVLPILTISDDPKFIDEGGIVRLRVVDGRMRFDINATAAQHAGLRISSQLLQLAVTVRGG